MTQPTAAQIRVLSAIRVWCESHRYAPTNRDLMAVLGFNSTNAVADHLKALRKLQLVDWDRGVARGLWITAAGLEVLHEAI